ncbi:MAG TPA: hypothetical protein P5080_00165 [Candidatus Paceibacterota bacterium]|nr:hypothetical protein [Candidatus Pacearchaeota archaeon]HRZ50388.1 hypothetical protein [Candidatus Paceibacterota bacterium]HSA36109.1 hypothetical protein [Candidatus Paceibacterota bacterium]
MNKKLIFAALAIAVMAAVAYAGLFLNKSGVAGPVKEETKSELKISIHSIKELIESDSPLKCEYLRGSGPRGMLDNGDVSFYAAGGKVRLDMDLNEASGAAASGSSVHVIIDNGIEYVWPETDGNKESGMMYDLVRISNGDLAAPEPGKIVIVEQERDLECVFWTADESVLTVPSEVLFIEYPAIGEAEL